MLSKCHWIVLYTVHFTALFRGAVFSRTRCSGLGILKSSYFNFIFKSPSIFSRL